MGVTLPIFLLLFSCCFLRVEFSYVSNQSHRMQSTQYWLNFGVERFSC